MKKLTMLFALAIALTAVVGCTGKKETKAETPVDSTAVEVPDTAIYGIVGEGTTMSVLELLTEEGKTMQFEINTDSLSDIQGGIFAGDRVTLTCMKGSEMPVVCKVVNLTTLLGKWTSLDRNFEIKEDGVVESALKTESRPYTHWSMSNASLILNTDTFSVLLLGPDSLSLENENGIFVFKRQGVTK